MSRYPRLTERPSEWRLNPEWPLYGALGAWFFGSHQGTAYVADASRRRNHAALTGFAGAGNLPVNAWRWFPSIRRFGVWFDGVNDYAITGRNSVGAGAITLAWWGQKTSPNVQIVLMDKAAFYDANGVEVYADTQLYVRGGSGTAANSTSSVYGGMTTMRHQAIVIAGTTATFYVDGKADGSGANDLPTARAMQLYIGHYPGLGYFYTGGQSDLLQFDGDQRWALPYIADPSNVDLRVGGIPAVLPVRTWYPVAVPPSFKPSWARHCNTLIGA